ncbi:metallophosphoesterase [Bacillus luti]
MSRILKISEIQGDVAMKKYKRNIPKQPEIPAKPDGCLRFIQTGDWHLGYSTKNSKFKEYEDVPQITAETQSKVNIRQNDVDQRAMELVDVAVEHHADLILNGGDFYDSVWFTNPYITNKGMEICNKASQAGIPHVIIPGNHDLPMNIEKDIELRKLGELPHVHTVSNGFYKKIDFPEHNLVIHCVPSSYTQEVYNEQLQQAGIEKEDGKVNFLISHTGVTTVGFYSENATNSIVVNLSDIVRLNMDYVVLADYHVPTEFEENISFSGPLERLGFGEEKNDPRFYIVDYDLKAKQVINKTPYYLNVRPMMDLPVLDVKDMTVEEIMALLHERISQTELEGAIVRQRIRHIADEVRILLDQEEIVELTKESLYFGLEFIDKIYVNEDIQVEEDSFEGPIEYFDAYLQRIDHNGAYNQKKFEQESKRILEESIHETIENNHA